MQARVVTSIVGIPVVISAVWVGLPWLTILVAIASLVALYEFYRLAPNSLNVISRTVGIFGVLGLVISVHFTIPGNLYLLTYVVLAILIITSMPLLAKFQSATKLAKPGLHVIVVFGPILVTFLLTHSLILRGSGVGEIESRNWLLYALFVTFAIDTGAFISGRIFGKHKLVPSISPNKTLEGAFGGLLSALLMSVALAYLLQLVISTWTAIWFGLLLGVTGQLGDLVESYMKRIFDVKDTGGILPGHGGLLDRIDSLVVTIPLVYYLVAFIV